MCDSLLNWGLGEGWGDTFGIIFKSGCMCLEKGKGGILEYSHVFAGSTSMCPIFSLPGQSPGGAIVLPPASALALGRQRQ